MIRNGLPLALALLLAGCAGLRIPSLLDGETEERQVIQLINYAQRVATMTAEEQRGEYGANNQAFTTDMDEVSRMRLALLLATPGASVYDAGRAANLLEPMATLGEAASPMRALAKLLHAQLDERARAQKRANQTREQLEARKDAERSVREQLEARKDGERNLRQQIEAQKEVERTLRQQLEALKEVERTIMQRGKESQPRRR